MINLTGVDGRREKAGFLFSMVERFIKGVGKVLHLKAGNTELPSMKSIRAFLDLSPGQVLRADGAEN